VAAVSWIEEALELLLMAGVCSLLSSQTRENQVGSCSAPAGPETRHDSLDFSWRRNGV